MIKIYSLTNFIPCFDRSWHDEFLSNFSDRIAWISVAILILLFMVQRFGTDKVGYTFAPVITIWFICIATIGIFNFCKYDPLVFKAINPMYIVHYFKRNGKTAWISLGGAVLCVTGTYIQLPLQNFQPVSNVIELECNRSRSIVC